MPGRDTAVKLRRTLPPERYYDGLEDSLANATVQTADIYVGRQALDEVTYRPGLLEWNNLVPPQLGGICIACAGGIDMGRGLVTSSPNLPGWKDVPLAGAIHGRFGVETMPCSSICSTIRAARL